MRASIDAIALIASSFSPCSNDAALCRKVIKVATSPRKVIKVATSPRTSPRIGELRECHAQVLVETGKTFDLAVAAIALHVTPKGVHRQIIDDLRKNDFACIHGPCPPAIPQKHGGSGFSISSR